MHSHSQGDPTSGGSRRPAPIGAGPALVLAAIVLPLVIATIAGLVLLWPSGESKAPSLLTPGSSFVSATVQSVKTGNCGGTAKPSASAPGARPPQCASAKVRVDEGPDKGRSVSIDVPPDAADVGLTQGREMVLVRIPHKGSPTDYSLQDVKRGTPLLALALIFALAVILVARLRGFLALVGLGFAALVMGRFMLPALLAGSSPILVGLTASAAIMLVVLYLAHGPSARTTTALLGTFAGLAMTAALAAWSVGATHLTGLTSDDTALLAQQANRLQPRSLLLCGIMLAGLGVLNDVTITQSSAVWELREAAPDLKPAALFSRAMRIGRDHIGSTIYTIVFAYAGAALPALLLIELYQQPLSFVLGSGDIAEEIVRTLVSATGLVLAVPLTTALAVAVATAAPRRRGAHGAHGR